MNQRLHKHEVTERSALAQLPDDIFGFDARALSRAASFGLVPMQEGWIAGGLIGKLAVARMKSNMRQEDQKMSPASQGKGQEDESLQSSHPIEVDPSLTAKKLLHLRTDLVKRGLIR